MTISRFVLETAAFTGISCLNVGCTLKVAAQALETAAFTGINCLSVGCTLKVAAQALESAAFTAISCLRAGFRLKVAAEAVGSYLIGRGISSTVGKIVDFAYCMKYKEPQAVPSYIFMRGITTWLSYPLIHAKVFPYAMDKINRYLDRSKALDFFGLGAQASAQEIGQAFRKFAKQYHPDHNPNSADYYRQGVLAKELLTQTF
jgi:hypothetical protein